MVTGAGGGAGTNGGTSADGSGGSSGTGGSANSISSGTGGSSNGDGGLATPATVTMMAGGSATTIGASICQTLIGGGVGYSLDPRSTSDCPPGGTAYMSFLLNTGSGEYSASAGDRMASDGGVFGPVTFDSSSEGTLSTAGTSDERDDVTMLNAGQTITIVTADRSVTLEFDGNDVTVSSFVEK